MGGGGDRGDGVMGEPGIGCGALESYHERMMDEDWVNLGPRAGFLRPALACGSRLRLREEGTDVGFNRV